MPDARRHACQKRRCWRFCDEYQRSQYRQSTHEGRRRAASPDSTFISLAAFQAGRRRANRLVPCNIIVFCVSHDHLEITGLRRLRFVSFCFVFCFDRKGRHPGTGRVAAGSTHAAGNVERRWIGGSGPVQGPAPRSRGRHGGPVSITGQVGASNSLTLFRNSCLLPPRVTQVSDFVVRP